MAPYVLYCLSKICNLILYFQELFLISVELVFSPVPNKTKLTKLKQNLERPAHLRRT